MFRESVKSKVNLHTRYNGQGKSNKEDYNKKYHNMQKDIKAKQFDTRA